MVIWQFSTNYGTFVAYCVLYGLTAGGFVSLLPVITADIVGVENIQRGLGMAYMTTVIGNLLGTPIIWLDCSHSVCRFNVSHIRLVHACTSNDNV